MKRLILSLALCVFVTAFAFAAGLGTLLTRNVQEHDQEYHPHDHDMFKALIAPSIGGVISQSLAVGPSGETKIVLSLPSADQYSDEIIVSFGDTQGRLSVDYDLLVRASLFVDGGRTSLYTYYDEDDDVLPNDFARRAGFLAALPEEGMIAIEFRSPRYIQTLYRADLEMNSCVASKDNELMRMVNRDLEAEASKPTFTHTISDSSYIVSDLGEPFVLADSGSELTLNGTLRRFYWTAEAGEFARVYSVEVFDRGVCSQSDATTLSATEELFGVIALLRSARSYSAAGFARFMEAIAAEGLIEANPEPWIAYTEAARELYPNLNE